VQFRVEGPVEKADPSRSDAYFAGRPRVSQLGAWASAQSQPLASRETLVEKVRALDAEYAGRPVPRPPHWGGYRVTPESIEHWVEGDSRLHDRFLYVREGARWRATRLYP
jgi:pyridoxamine 5'-phosphate oxidase